MAQDTARVLDRLCQERGARRVELLASLITVKVARSALRIPLARGEMAGVRETVMAAATYILRGGADAMAVNAASGEYNGGSAAEGGV
jgi:hypothetical protein